MVARARRGERQRLPATADEPLLEGILYVWTMPENFTDFYALPPK